jgi:hypothetical protein
VKAQLRKKFQEERLQKEQAALLKEKQKQE